jgi:hypothetical protein
VDWTSVSKAIDSFLAAPYGKLFLLIFVISIALWGFYAVRRLEISNSRNQREAELEKARLANQENEDARRTQVDLRMATALDKYAEGQKKSEENAGLLLAIIQRMESKLQSDSDTLKDAKSTIEAVAIRAANMHKDLRSGVVTLSGKLDHANSESATRAENTQQVINNRAQETQKTVHAVGGNIQATLNGQNAVLDQLLTKLGELNKEVTGLRGDFKDNMATQAATTARLDDERFASIQTALREIAQGLVQLKRGTQPLDPSKAPADPLAITTTPADIRTTQTLATVTPPQTITIPNLTEITPDAT